jgi:hypothetical protein
MLPVLHPARPHLGVVVGQEVAAGTAGGAGVALDVGGIAADEKAEQVARGSGQDGVRQGKRAGRVAHLEAKHGRMIAGVRIGRVELGVGAERHGGEPQHLRAVARLRRLHDPVEEPVEPLPRCHLTDVRRRPGRERALAAELLRASPSGVGHVGRHGRGRVPDPKRDGGEECHAQHARHEPRVALTGRERGTRLVCGSGSGGPSTAVTESRLR